MSTIPTAKDTVLPCRPADTRNRACGSLGPVKRTLSAGDLYATPWTYELLVAFVDERSPLTAFYSTIDWGDVENGEVHLPVRDSRSGMAPSRCLSEV